MGGTVAATTGGKGFGQFGLVQRTARLIGQDRPGKGRRGQVAQRQAELLDQSLACLGNGGSGLGKLQFNRIEPARVRLLLVRQQAVAFAQCALQLGGVLGIWRGIRKSYSCTQTVDPPR